MAPEPVSKPNIAPFPVAKLAPLLRALADPAGTGTLPREDAETIRRIESNLAPAEDQQ